MTATDAQVRIAMSERKRGRTQQQAAAAANLRSRKTVAKYEETGRLPSETREPRTYRTHADAFGEDWPTLEAMLAAESALEAKALFDWLCEEKPGRYTEGQLRTFQRRVGDWKALNVDRDLVLAQDRKPGQTMQTDGTDLSGLRVTIRGEPFDHLLIHSVLPYSNWEWGVVAQSESLLAITRGFQAAVWELGHVPRDHQTDNASAATHDVADGLGEQELADSGRAYNDRYLAVMDNYGVTPRTTHLDSPDENGDAEAANGALQRALTQALILRRSRDFDSVEEYEQWLQAHLTKRNHARRERLEEELAVMLPVDASRIPDRRELRPRVSRYGTVQVLGNPYSVPSGLRGKRVTVYVYEWHVDVYFGGRLVRRTERQIGRGKPSINYRHVIGTLLRKPGGFRNYRYRDAMFPRLVFRRAWEELDSRMSPRRCDLTYLRVLKLAKDTLECDVAAALEVLLEAGEPWTDRDVADLVQPAGADVPDVQTASVDLREYDALLCLEGNHGGQ